MRPGDLSYNVIFLNVSRFVILLYCCKFMFLLSAVSINAALNSGSNTQLRYLNNFIMFFFMKLNTKSTALCG